jgi:hypothetical protein
MATRAAMDWLPNQRRACMYKTVPATAGTQQPLVRSRLEHKATGQRDHHSGTMRETAQVSSHKGKWKKVYVCTRECARCPPVTPIKRGQKSKNKDVRQNRARGRTCARGDMRDALPTCRRGGGKPPLTASPTGSSLPILRANSASVHVDASSTARLP